MARSLNKIMLIGNLGKDPELRSTSSGTAVATFSMATNRSWKDQSGEWQEETQWHNVVVWGNPAETITNYCKKGSKLFIEGRLTYRSWEGQDGQKRYTTEIVAETYVILDQSTEGTGRGEPIPPPPPPEGLGPQDDDDVPF